MDAWDEESLIGRGSCYTVTGRNAKAIEDFSKLLSVPDKDRKVPRKHLLYVIAENYRKMEEWGQAVYWAKLAPERRSRKRAPPKIIRANQSGHAQGNDPE